MWCKEVIVKHERMIFNRDSYLRQSSSLLAWGWLLFLGGIIMLAVDSTTSFPTPLRGAFTFYWAVFAAIGLLFLRKRERLAFGSAEKLLCSEFRLTVDDVSRQLDLNPSDARDVMEALVNRRTARVRVTDTPSEGDDTDYVIELP